jgi:hypothetical protein
MNPLLMAGVKGFQSALQEQINDPNLDSNSRSVLQQRLQGSLEATEKYMPSSDASGSKLPDLSEYLASANPRFGR